MCDCIEKVKKKQTGITEVERNRYPDVVAYFPMEETKVKTASVKVMLSYDYSHFEASMSIENENGLTLREIDAARKNCQRLADKAVGQYKKAKETAANRSNSVYEIANFKSTCEAILRKPEQDRTVKEVAMLKQYEDESWQSQFDYQYDYDDDDKYNF